MASFRSRARGQAAGIRAEMELDGDAFMRSLRTAVEQIKIDTEADLWRFALSVQNLARAIVPVDTGRLRSSIQASKGSDGDGVYADIGTNVYYAAFVEFGTIHMAAQPYLRPALAMSARAWGSYMGHGLVG